MCKMSICEIWHLFSFFFLVLLQITNYIYSPGLKTVKKDIYLFRIFTSFSGHRPAQRECTQMGLRSHARHPYPIPQPVKVGHTTGVYNLSLFEQWCGFFYVPQEQISESAVRRDLQFFVLIRED